MGSVSINNARKTSRQDFSAFSGGEQTAFLLVGSRLWIQFHGCSPQGVRCSYLWEGKKGINLKLQTEIWLSCDISWTYFAIDFQRLCLSLLVLLGFLVVYSVLGWVGWWCLFVWVVVVVCLLLWVFCCVVLGVFCCCFFVCLVGCFLFNEDFRLKKDWRTEIRLMAMLATIIQASGNWLMFPTVELVWELCITNAAKNLQNLYSFLKLCTANEKKHKTHPVIKRCTLLKFLLEENE